MKEFTKAEEQIMQILWELNEGVVHDIIERMPNPKPAYNTVSTIIRILEKKEVVGHKAYGKTHVYIPLIKKDEYTRGFLKGFVGRFFGNSYKQLVSFFSTDKDLSVSEMEEIIQILQEKIDSKPKK
jgi:BlaI family penicillinase repressor